MSNKISQRKRTIFKTVLLFHACGLLFISYVNDWFGMRTPSVQEKPRLQEKEIKNEKKIREEKIKDEIKKQRVAASKIYLPRQKVSEKQMGKSIDKIDKKPERPIERKEHLAFKEKPLTENAEKKEKVETERGFDFEDYKVKLTKNYGFKEGESIPQLFIDDHDKNELYKEGLQFYGYQIIARPKVRPGQPFYFVINRQAMMRIDEVCPYTGLFPSVLQEDHKLFKRLLYQPQFAEMPNRKFELFYAPVDIKMMAILESKLKLIIEEFRLTTNEISRMIGTFKEIGDSYILIIESVVTIDGRIMKVHDPDNRIMTASLN